MSYKRAIIVGVISTALYTTQSCFEPKDFYKPRTVLEKSQASPIYGLAYVGLIGALSGFAITGLEKKK